MTNMGSMFGVASAFNQDLSSWNTAAVTRMDYMFYYASAFQPGPFSAPFNQDISTWDVMAVTNNERMWDGETVITYTHTPCTATGVGADGKYRWRICY